MTVLITAPPNFPVVFVIDNDVVNGRFMSATVIENRPACVLRYSGNVGPYEFLNGNIRTSFATSVFPDSERSMAETAAKA